MENGEMGNGEMGNGEVDRHQEKKGERGQ